MDRIFRGAASLAAMSLAFSALGDVRPARAQDAASIQSIERQIQQLQSQLKRLQVEAAQRDADLRRAQEDAAAARAQAREASQRAAQPIPTAPALPPGAMVVTIPPNDKDASGRPVFNKNKPNGKFSLGGVTVTLGGFVELDGIFRSRSENRGTSSSFTGIPFHNVPDGHLNELRGTAQQTRVSVLIEGKASDTITVAAYTEADFNNGAGGANSVQSNSYTPRLRQAYAQIDEAATGLHLVAGQTWSLATAFKSGLKPRSELIPTTIDTAYLPGFTYLRVPELRLTKEFGGKYWIALAADDPQSSLSGLGTAPSTIGGLAPTVVTTSPLTPGTGLNPQTNYSYSVAPDLILKAAADTPFGHYELFGLARWFKDRVEFATPAGSGRASTNITFGGGVGASAYVPIIPSRLEFQGNITYGKGIGRYGAGNLPDVTYKADGSLTPLTEIEAMVGLVGHPDPSLDVYGFAGIEQIEKKTFVAGGRLGGYGTGIGSNAGCNIENSGAFTPALSCSANNRRLAELTAGFWWRFLRGGWGTMQAGAQYGIAERETFNTTGGVKTAPEHLIYAGLRYTPFQ